MKKLVLLSFAALCLAGCKKDSDTIVTTPPSKVEGLELAFYRNAMSPGGTKTIYFLDDNVGFVVDYDGSIYKTGNGAQSWDKQNSGTTLPLYDICFLSNTEGFAVGGSMGCNGTGCIPPGALILHTLNGGETWVPVALNLSQKIELHSLCFTGDSTGFAVGSNMILSTKDRGLSWQETTIPNTGCVFMDIAFASPTKGLIACTKGKVLKTADGGITWTLSAPFQFGSVNELSVVSESLAFSCSGNTLNKTTDFGNSWQKVPGLLDEGVSNVSFKTDQLGFAFGPGDYSGGDFGYYYTALYHTMDGGATWKGNRNVHEIGLIESCSCPQPNLCYGVSGNMVIKLKRL